MDNPSPAVRLSFKEKLSYGIGDVGNALAVSSVSFWLLIYLTDMVGLGASLAGVAMMIGRAWDALSDPVVGWASDNTQTRWGKRRPFLLFAALPYTFFYCLLWTIPELNSELATFIYVTVVLVFFNTCFALIIVPYASLTAAMTNDYNERLSLTGFRMVCAQSAFLIGAVFPSFLVLWITDPEGGRVVLTNLGLSAINEQLFGSWAYTARQGYAVMALLFTIIMLAGYWTCFAGIKERGTTARKSSSHSANPFSYIGQILKQLKSNPPFRMAISILCLSECAAALVAINLPYFVRYVLDLEQYRTWILFSLFAGAICAIPLWTHLGRRFGKAETYKIVVRCYAVILCFLPLLPQGALVGTILVALAGGICHSAALMIPWSMIPDVVEYDQLKSGERREGLFYGGALFSYKLATALGVLLSGLALDLIQYVPNQDQTPSTVLGMKILICVGPGIFLLSAAWLAGRYPLNSAKHGEILAALREKGRT